MKDSQKNGLWGEIFAARYLREKGYEVVSANYRSRFGEIDIIAQDDAYLCFVEVKTRGADAIAAPGESVDAAKQKRISLTAAQFLTQNPTARQPRFDVLEVYLDAQSRNVKIRLLQNAFDSTI